jgi:hypothetical protein
MASPNSNSSPYSVPVTQPQLAGWSPFKSKGGEPPTPPAIGRAPLGGDNPRFPTIGPKEITPPPGGYQSIISIAPAIDAAKQHRIMRVPIPITQEDIGRAGSASLSGIARALRDSANAVTGGKISQLNQQIQAQSQKSRAEDILSQKQSATDATKMVKGNAVADEDIRTAFDTSAKGNQQAYWTERWNQEAERIAILLRFLGGLF